MGVIDTLDDIWCEVDILNDNLEYIEWMATEIYCLYLKKPSKLSSDEKKQLTIMLYCTLTQYPHFFINFYEELGSLCQKLPQESVYVLRECLNMANDMWGNKWKRYLNRKNRGVRLGG